MSKFDEKVTEMLGVMKEKNIACNQALFTKVVKGLGPSIYNADSAFVSTSDKSEVERVKQNFLIKKLGLSEADDLDGAIKEVAEKMGKSNPRKYRAIFYYLLAEHFGKLSVYE
ncbi:DUF2853 family protein [Ornithobacterium rhinotracheale]|uniref:DUF2853 family protein n=1 Tax=Ornithobacterium rhinotracheale (strain ATCC 51463 / DSM 15997 / CCUG 23171 / CIP 104009 / LMG 9086) TaxID=867902 RepID=I3ZYN0_ORNRL|nr:Protein of unknown function (DUF2853) [Ornithobacterium rhinotracheale DSM 15997]AIP99422.1 hypothetical protein Q785_06665 [Ornithobacterium rhinotracheale ORT-UMN 88]KGB66465.1 hypothetical protein Q787_06480 [Ornithobacterium rhinotracheale H06-030791]MBN3663098.1 DUF2853 family protein [Ornithobacterium rhinotracheale]